MYADSAPNFSYNANAQCSPVDRRDRIFDPCRQHGL